MPSQADDEAEHHRLTIIAAFFNQPPPPPLIVPTQKKPRDNQGKDGQAESGKSTAKRPRRPKAQEPPSIVVPKATARPSSEVTKRSQQPSSKKTADAITAVPAATTAQEQTAKRPRKAVTQSSPAGQKPPASTPVSTTLAPSAMVTAATTRSSSSPMPLHAAAPRAKAPSPALVASRKRAREVISLLSTGDISDSNSDSDSDSDWDSDGGAVAADAARRMRGFALRKLPAELLELVLGAVPRADLLNSCRFVCRTWWRIITFSLARSIWAHLHFRSVPRFLQVMHGSQSGAVTQHVRHLALQDLSRANMSPGLSPLPAMVFNLPKLATLQLQDTGLPCGFLAEYLPASIRVLKLHNCRFFSSESTLRVASNPTCVLEKLEIIECSDHLDEALRPFLQSRHRCLSSLRALRLERTDETELNKHTFLSVLKVAPALQKLSLNRSAFSGEFLLSTLIAQHDRLRSLHSISLTACDFQLTAATMSVFFRLFGPQLRSLSISLWMSIDMALPLVFTWCRSLLRLDIAACRLSRSSTMSLPSLPSLQQIDARDVAPATFNEFTALLQAAPNMTTAVLPASCFLVVGPDLVRLLKNLKRLEVIGSTVLPTELEYLRRSLTTCRVIHSK